MISLKNIWPILVGVIALLFGFFMIINGNSLFERCTKETTATVIQLENSNSDNKVELYYPVIEYEVNGDVYSGESSIGVKSDKYKVGQKIKIFYNPNEVSEFMLEKNKFSRYIGVFSFITSIVFITFGSISFLRAKNNE